MLARAYKHRGTAMRPHTHTSITQTELNILATVGQEQPCSCKQICPSLGTKEKGNSHLHSLRMFVNKVSAPTTYLFIPFITLVAPMDTSSERLVQILL